MKIMIVEDEVLLSLELASEIEDAGHAVVAETMSQSETMLALAGGSPDFAFVDIQLADGPTGIDIGRTLSGRNIPYVFMSGNTKRIPEDFAGAIGAIEKPYSVNGLRNALTFVEGLLEGRCRMTDAPPSIIANPRWRAEKPAAAVQKHEEKGFAR